jgi:hypothetical protein
MMMRGVRAYMIKIEEERRNSSFHQMNPPQSDLCYIADARGMFSVIIVFVLEMKTAMRLQNHGCTNHPYW